MHSASAIDRVISHHLAELSKPGVLSIRPGYQAAEGWLTKKPAIVVTVRDKHDPPNAGDRLPETLGGFPVDVRQAGPLQRMRVSNMALYSGVAAAARPELQRPQFPYEHDLGGLGAQTAAAAVEALRATPKPQVPYAPPAGIGLNGVVGNLTITCHVSPDAGWPTLKPFLQGTTKTLTVGMYDFTSAHILRAVESALKGKQLKLVLDHPAPNKTSDQTDEDTVNALEQAIGAGFKFAWALERGDPNASAWIYPNAYHIKVAVRDGTEFWLSSGNWNNSNQPDFDPVTHPAGAGPLASKSDRDWHVIVEHSGLAAVYEAYLLNDLSVAGANQATAAGAAADAALAALGQLAEPELAVAARAPKQYFAPKQITAKMKVQPLLTPDNYAQFILPLIKSAKRSFFMQTQYIHPSSKPGDATLAGLIEAVARKASEGVDVRLIMSQYETLDKLELLQDAGVDLRHVRIQANVHNKGIVVDSQVVVVSSQNWSGDGVAHNRDAGLIIYNEEAAQYWEQIFIHDWAYMSAQHAGD